MITRLTFRLKPGKDDDLINWLSELPEQERSRFVRDTLRRGLTLPKARPTIIPPLDFKGGQHTEPNKENAFSTRIERDVSIDNLEEKLDRLADNF